MAALLIASPRAMALGLQIHRPPCKLIHLSAFSIAPFFPIPSFFQHADLQRCCQAEQQRAKADGLSCPLPQHLPSPGLREHPRCRSSPGGVRTLTWPRVWGQPEHRGSAGGRGFCCLLTLGVKEQNEKEVKDGPGEPEPSHESLNKYKEERKLPWWSCTLPQLMFCFLTGLILRIRGEPATVFFTASVRRN